MTHCTCGQRREPGSLETIFQPSCRNSSRTARTARGSRWDEMAAWPRQVGVSPQVKALIIREPWIGHILSGAKTWEMRTSKTSLRGRIGLIRKGSGVVVGVADI